MKKTATFIMLIIMLTTLCFLSIACTEDDILSPDMDNRGLLPDRSDYLSEDYGTQALANEIAGIYNSSIAMVVYDETRINPLLTLTKGKTNIHIKALKSGAVAISYRDFQTTIMPLMMSVTIKGLLEKRDDTILIRGTDGVARTKAGKKMPIGTPLPESDDVELTGVYNTTKNKLGMLIDLMLPVPVKALVKAEKN